MRSACLFFLLSATLSWALPAAAAPSFPCGGRLTETERTICDSQILSDLDWIMADLYEEVHGEGAASRKLTSEQTLWLRWRDTCGTGGSCLRRRYEQRIIDLAPAQGLPPGFGCAESPYGGVPIRAELPPPSDG